MPLFLVNVPVIVKAKDISSVEQMLKRKGQIARDLLTSALWTGDAEPIDINGGRSPKPFVAGDKNVPL